MSQEERSLGAYSSIPTPNKDIERADMYTGVEAAPKSTADSILFHFNRLKYVLLYSLLLIYGMTLLFAAINKLTAPNDESKQKKVLTFNETINPVNNLKKVSYDTIRFGDLKPTYKPLQWLVSAGKDVDEDKGLYSTMVDDKYLIKSVLDVDYEKLLFPGKAFEYGENEFKIDDFISSPDLKYALLRTNSTRLWRHSFHADYYILNVASQKIELLAKSLTMVSFAPNSKTVAYVLDNDLFIYHILTGEIQRASDSGSQNIFNGKADWVYEEEILESDKAVWWSPDSKHITYLNIDETDVAEYSINYYVPQAAGQPIPSYPELKTLKYPKSGSPNPVVSVKVFSLELEETVTYELDEPTQLINEIVYLGDTRFLAKITDRTATYLKVFVMDVKGSDKFLQRLQFDEEEWIELTHYTTHVPASDKYGDTEGYLDVIPIDGFNHLVYYQSLSSDNFIQLTSGEWEVVDGVASFDKKKRIVWFIGTKKSSIERHLYFVSLNDPLKIHEVTDVSKDGYYSASFSAGSRFALLNYMGPDIPYQNVIDFEDESIAKVLYTLEENKKLKENIPLYDIPQKNFQQLNIGPDSKGEDIILNSFEILPNNFNPNLKNHYPVFFFGYNGPNSQQVNKVFSVGLNQVIASQLNAIFVCVDTRGTGFLGKKHRSLVRDNLGQHESSDFIEVAKLYTAKSYVNAEKTLIYGWSYGGFMSLFTLQKDEGRTFKYAISVAPVTNWLLYDSVYTERYMSLPKDNHDGYQTSSINNVESIFKAQRVLLMHGLGDDNVHFQNAANFIDQAVVKKAKNFDVKVFPDSDHSISYHGAYDIVMDELISWAGQAFNGDFEGRWEY